ncbi:MAG: glycosyltransferase family 2 protein [Pseudomonadota bacterium]
MPAITVAIINYNAGPMLQAAVDSLAAQSFRDFEVILIDNGSEDGSTAHLQTADLPAFHLINPGDNLGFAAGNNLAAKEGTGRWLALLNPDAEAAPNWLAKLLEATERHPDVKAFASAQYDVADPGKLDGVGDSYLIFGVPWRGGFGRSARELPEEGYCFSPCGAGAFYDRETFLAHGGYDERFFCYCEDVDLGFRMQLAGEPCVFVPAAAIRHAGSALAGRASEFTVFHGARNRVWTYAKNMPLPLLVLTLPGHLAIAGYLLLRAAMTRRLSPLWRGMKAGYGQAREIRRTSAFGPPKRRASLWRLARAMAWNPWRMSAHQAHVRPL